MDVWMLFARCKVSLANILCINIGIYKYIKHQSGQTVLINNNNSQLRQSSYIIET